MCLESLVFFAFHIYMLWFQQVELDDDDNDEDEQMDVDDDNSSQVFGVISVINITEKKVISLKVSHLICDVLNSTIFQRLKKHIADKMKYTICCTQLPAELRDVLK